MLRFKYERKRIKKEKILPPACRDYVPMAAGSCEKAKACKNATYSIEGEECGVCYGGTRSSEMEDRTKKGR